MEKMNEIASPDPETDAAAGEISSVANSVDETVPVNGKKRMDVPVYQYEYATVAPTANDSLRP